MTKKLLLGIGLLAMLVYAVLLQMDMPLAQSLVKAIPLVVLIMLTPRTSSYGKMIAAGFVFSLLGDVLLSPMVGNFIAGLAAFFVAHVFYLIAFIGRSKKAEWLSALPFYAIAAGMFLWLQSGMGELIIPVLLYMCVIMAMGWRAFVQRNSEPAALFAFYGALFFIVSDSLIAINKFHFADAMPLANYLIIYTYWIAQALILKSVVADVFKMSKK